MDSCSTVSVFKTPEDVTNIRRGKRTLTALTNGGKQESRDIADTKYFGQVWFNEESMANIFSLADVCKYARVTMDSDVKKSMFVHREDGYVMEFKQYKSGLYYFDVAEQVGNSNHSSNMNYDYLPSFSLVQTVEENKSKYTRRELSNAEKARSLRRKIGHPSQQDFEYYLKENFIRNCPLTVADAKRAEDIYGPEVYSLQGKTVKKKGQHARTFTPIVVAPNILDAYENDTLRMDNFYVNGNVFFHTITRRMKFRTVAAVRSRRKQILLNEAKTVLNLYESKGYNITDIHADKEFQCIREEMRPVELNICATDDHVPEIEMSARTVKE